MIPELQSPMTLAYQLRIELRDFKPVMGWVDVHRHGFAVPMQSERCDRGHQANRRFEKPHAADVPTRLRLIQSIPSPKAEPFKRWLAKVGHERISGVAKADKFALLTHIIHQEWTGLSVQAHK